MHKYDNFHMSMTSKQINFFIYFSMWFNYTCIDMYVYEHIHADTCVQ
jgi:hypothetical protein